MNKCTSDTPEGICWSLDSSKIWSSCLDKDSSWSLYLNRILFCFLISSVCCTSFSSFLIFFVPDGPSPSTVSPSILRFLNSSKHEAHEKFFCQFFTILTDTWQEEQVVLLIGSFCHQHSDCQIQELFLLHLQTLVLLFVPWNIWHGTTYQPFVHVSCLLLCHILFWISSLHPICFTY